MDAIDQAAELLRAAEAACEANPIQAQLIASDAMHSVMALPRTTDQAERVIRLVILRLNVLATKLHPEPEDDVWAIARRAKASTHSA